MLLWLQRRGATPHRTEATVTFVFENVVKPMVLATFFAGAEANSAQLRQPAVLPPEPLRSETCLGNFRPVLKCVVFHSEFEYEVRLA